MLRRVLPFQVESLTGYWYDRATNGVRLWRIAVLGLASLTVTLHYIKICYVDSMSWIYTMDPGRLHELTRLKIIPFKAMYLRS